MLAELQLAVAAARAVQAGLHFLAAAAAAAAWRPAGSWWLQLWATGARQAAAQALHPVWHAGAPVAVSGGLLDLAEGPVAAVAAWDRAGMVQKECCSAWLAAERLQLALRGSDGDLLGARGQKVFAWPAGALLLSSTGHCGPVLDLAFAPAC